MFRAGGECGWDIEECNARRRAATVALMFLGTYTTPTQYWSVITGM